MFVILGLIGIVPGILMIVGIVSVFRMGIRYGEKRARRRNRQ